MNCCSRLFDRQQMQKSTMPPPRTSLLPASSRLKQPQLVAPRVTAVSQMQPTRNVAADELNSTVVVEKPVVVHPVAVPLPPPAAAAVPTAAPAPPVFSGIPRPSMSRIPAPRTMLKYVEMVCILQLDRAKIDSECLMNCQKEIFILDFLLGRSSIPTMAFRPRGPHWNGGSLQSWDTILLECLIQRINTFLI